MYIVHERWEHESIFKMCARLRFFQRKLAYKHDGADHLLLRHEALQQQQIKI